MLNSNDFLIIIGGINEIDSKAPQNSIKKSIAMFKKQSRNHQIPI